MKILYIVPYVPNLIRVRPFNLIRHLNAQGHEVTVATLWSSEQEFEDIERLKKEYIRVIANRLPKWRSIYNSLIALPQPVPLQSRYCWHPALFKQIVSLFISFTDNSPFDIIHVEHLRGAEFGLRMKLQQASASNHTLFPPIVWDSVDCISYLFRQAAQRGGSIKSRALTALELSRTSRFESRAVEVFDQVLVTSPVDQRELARLAREERDARKIEVVRNGVDLAYFVPGEQERVEDTIIVSGKMSYHANVAMVQHLINQIMPQVWSKKPDVKVMIVGKDPPPSIRNLSEKPNVIVTGTVEDIRPYLQKATLAVAPITYGAGIQNKILESMACSTPVITYRPAVSALDVESGANVLVVDSQEQFSESILNLLDQPERRKFIGEAGRKYVEKYHDWNLIASQLVQIYEATIENAQYAPEPGSLHYKKSISTTPYL